ncbi:MULTISPECIES: tRNA adenosine(34) deaminase TadA [Dehalobacter]|jgi:tRNA(adenine34) deaminase|uniref:tRNA-specific adenosine deaminase n=2 Tax=Dehalobacter restrictus TaxID=55583 RepID=A0A857DFZ4_9FIRM|nr:MULTISPECIES: tRNA adenosine(34) deaminase TadA [Dehalobacter]AHF08722.1 adenosine deaminase [Dehalobacter restrictus DSM 9455]MCG1024182.1 tRNA adenosine(34) deaminase TadA [Dehalobacter sp.]MDJ0305335.1 tRNA adenosine(34) deaminase TadA [Dehalobacter sp.]OCZ49817.1 tRNA-specific adenosine deaminase [Dehalobacter sp. TeCB1]QGZ99175.1 tRNA adenosine(34) deaminase TadA [Dehalobacter restrictus]
MKHEDWMRLALDQAQKAYDCNEIPVGALVVVNQQILSVAFNEKEQKQDPTGHAEILAIRRAAEVMGHWRLTDATLYVTLEPCPMCAGAILQARIKHLIYGATDAKGGAVESVMNVLNRNCWNHKVEVTAGVLEEECSVLLKQYFREKRTKA